jgi:hypothetical protein
LKKKKKRGFSRIHILSGLFVVIIVTTSFSPLKVGGLLAEYHH